MACHLGRYDGELSYTLVLPKPFVIAEKEGWIFPDGSAQGSPELVAAKWRNRCRIEMIASVERAVAQKFIGGPVQRICALPGNGIDHAS